MPALPYCKATIKALWKPSVYPKTLNHIGDHLRTRRLDLGLHQRDVALRLGVHAASVRNWEMGRTEPTLDLLRRVIEFLGYDPRVRPESVGERIKAWRTARGLSQEEMARRFGIDPGTLGRWERGEREPMEPFRALVKRFRE